MSLSSLELSIVVACALAGVGCSSGGEEDGAYAAGAGGSASGGTSAGGSLGGGAASVAGAGGSSSASDECREGCEATVAAGCPNGPPTQAQCEADCSMLESGPCSSEYQALQGCAQGETISCAAGIPFIEACATEQNALFSCLN